MNDNECFKWCLVRYLHPTDHHPTRARKVNKLFEVKLDFEDMKFPDKIEKKHSFDISEN